MSAVRYSRGTSQFDNKPSQREAADFDAFAVAVLADRSKAKGQTYICAPFAVGNHNDAAKHPGIASWRQKHLAHPRAFLPFDFDGFDAPESFALVREWLARFQGFAYTTASSTPAAPRCRVVLAQSRETDRHEGKALCLAVQKMIERDLGAGCVKFDGSVYKSEQPLFTPLHGADVFRFAGQPVDVDAVLLAAPAPEADDVGFVPMTLSARGSQDSTTATRSASIAAGDPLMAALESGGMVKRQLSAGKFAVVCPCLSEHTGESGETSTVYGLPNFDGVRYGKFICQHDHCRARPQEQFIEALGLNPGDVWRAQAGRDTNLRDDDANAAKGRDEAAASIENGIIALESDMFDDDAALPHVVGQWIPCDEVTLLAGHGGGGKSYVALSIAVHVALGLPFGALPTTQSNVLFFSGEDGGRVLRQRLARICRALSIGLARLNGRLCLLDASDLDPALHREHRVNQNGKQSIVTETPMLFALAAVVERENAGLVIIDNASDAFDDDEIKRARVRAFVRSLRSRIARPGRAVLLLAHVNKASAKGGRESGAEDYSGSTAWHNSVRSRLSLIPDGADRLTIEHVKANLGAKAGPVRLEWHEGVPLVSGSTGLSAAQAARQAAENERDDGDKAALIAIVQDFDRRGELVNATATGAYSYFRLLKSEPTFPKATDSDRLTRLFRELQRDGLLFLSEVKTPDRKRKAVFTCAPKPAEGAPLDVPTIPFIPVLAHRKEGEKCAL